MGAGDHITQTELLEVGHDRVGNFEELVLVSHGISLDLTGFL